MLPRAPIEVLSLLPEERGHLLDLLLSTPRNQHETPTSCPGWSVKDIAAHLLGDDLAILSSGRDGHTFGVYTGSSWEELVDFINHRNELWVEALRRLSLNAICELLASTEERIQEYFTSLDLLSLGPNVAWAGEGRMPMWLHVAREYTERWVHQMQIRDALRAPGLYEPQLFHPVLDAFAYALPVAYRDVEAGEGTRIEVEIIGSAGGNWSLVRGSDEWQLLDSVEGTPAATIRMPQEEAWRVWTRGIEPASARAKSTIEGDEELGRHAFDAVAMIVG